MNLEKAINFIFSSINAFPIVENIKTHQSYGRVLAENLSSPRDIPPFDNSQVDGYVVNSSDINQHESFVISQRIPAGFPGTNLQPSTVARIFTGACIPENSDSVVMQEETQLVDKKVTFSQLKDLIYKIIYSLFGEEVELRFRPSYFPFTEPSAEVDILSKEGKWLEILGCGIVNPVVLENCKIDANKYSGLAFGLGVERIAMLKYGVTDIREFYKSNLDFLNQFK